MKNILILTYFISVLLIFSSCKGAYDFDAENLSTHVELETDIAIPLIDASITLEELLPKSDGVESFLVVDSENFITIKYKFDVTSVAIDEFLDGTPPSGDPLPLIDYNIDPQKVNMGLDKFLANGRMIIADPKVKISIKNYWSIPVHFRFKDFFYYTDEAGEEKFSVTGSATTDWHSIVPFSAPETYSVTDIVLNKTNSNFDEVISHLPHHLSFGAHFQTVPPTVPPTAYSVPLGITDSIKMNIEIPLDLGMENIIMQDTIEFAFGNSDTTAIEKLTIGTIIDNGFPMALNIQFVFIDDDGNVLASLFDGGLNIEAGTVDANGKINANTTSTNVSETNLTTINKILKATNVLYKVIINTPNVASGQTVKLYSDYNINIKMGARFKINPSY